METVRTARRTMIRALYPHRYALLSAWIKSMRIQQPKDALYYYHLVSKAPEMPPSQILRRLLCAAAEDSMSPWVLTDAAILWRDRNIVWEEGEFEKQKRALVVAIATLPNSYNSGAYGQQYNPAHWPSPDDAPDFTEKRVRKILFKDEMLSKGRAEFHRALRAFDAFAEYCEIEELYRLLGEFLTHRAKVTPWAFQLEPLATAFNSIVSDLYRMDDGMGRNWFTRCLFVACAGPPNGPSTHDAELQVDRLDRIARKRVKEDLARGTIRIPTYAYDGVHARPGFYHGQKVVDHRFAGTTKGVENMFAMASRDGKLRRDRQGIVTRCQPWMLAKPFIPVRL